jgi:hypothetical protein
LDHSSFTFAVVRLEALERHGPCCPALSWMDSRRVAGVTCGAFGIWLSHFLDQDFQLGRERQQIPALPASTNNLALVSWNFSHFAEVRSTTVHADGSVVQNSARRSMAKNSARLTFARIDEITCLIYPAVVIFALIGKGHDKFDARAPFPKELDGYRDHPRHFVLVIS